ncbi:MAG: diphthine--ammonia ligase [Acidobacteria bacterium]|nr:diphthine--ammonia ligase [Acidobacteriota bacterium]
MSKPRAAVSWSGGKDSYLALHRARQQFDVVALITMFTEDGIRSRSHGLRPEVLQRQAALLDLELLQGRGSWQSYEVEFKKLLRELRDRQFSHVVFGDIFLDDHKRWVERVCTETGLVAVEPLWEQPTSQLLLEFLNLGGEARIVAIKAALLDESWLGRPLSLELLPEFENLGIDPCGEYGEYHTLVTTSPLFTAPLTISDIGHHLHDGYWMLDVIILH